MSALRIIGILPVAALLIGLAGHAIAEPDDNAQQSRAASVTLDQLSPGTAIRPPGKGQTADLDVPQPARQPRATTVTSSEVSTRADGRALATSPVVGTDTCDPAERSAPAKLCRRRLETRASEYSRPRATQVTPEGRLLLMVNPSATPSGGAISGRDLGNSSGLNDPNGPAQQIAGALQERAAAQAGAPDSASPNASALPTGVPSIVVLPGGK